MKTCTKCGITKPLDAFGPRRSACRECAARRERERRAANREEYNRRNRERYAANREAENRRDRERHTANREEYNRRNRERRAANREEYNRRNRERRTANAARTDEQIAADRARLRPDGLKRCRRCRERLELDEFTASRANPDGLSYTCRSCDNRSFRAIAAPYWLAHGIDPAVCFWCGAPSEHVDHIKPLALGGTDAPENLIPACAPCNLSKNARPTHVWILNHAPARHDDPDLWLIDPEALDGWDWHLAA